MLKSWNTLIMHKLVAKDCQKNKSWVGNSLVPKQIEDVVPIWCFTEGIQELQPSIAGSFVPASQRCRIPARRTRRWKFFAREKKRVKKMAGLVENMQHRPSLRFGRHNIWNRLSQVTNDKLLTRNMHLLDTPCRRKSALKWPQNRRSVCLKEKPSQSPPVGGNWSRGMAWDCQGMVLCTNQWTSCALPIQHGPIE